MENDITGRKISRLTAIKYIGKIKGKSGYYWLFKCDCGKKKKIISKNVIRGGSKSCGCWQKELTKQNRDMSSIRKGFGVASRHQLYLAYKNGAKKRKLKFDLTEKQFNKMTSKNCTYCRAKPSNVNKIKGLYGDYIYNGIDRKDNGKGYIFSNCTACCKFCNYAKSRFLYEDFIAWINNLRKQK